MLTYLLAMNNIKFVVEQNRNWRARMTANKQTDKSKREFIKSSMTTIGVISAATAATGISLASNKPETTIKQIVHHRDKATSNHIKCSDCLHFNSTNNHCNKWQFSSHPESGCHEGDYKGKKGIVCRSIDYKTFIDRQKTDDALSCTNCDWRSPESICLFANLTATTLGVPNVNLPADKNHHCSKGFNPTHPRKAYNKNVDYTDQSTQSEKTCSNCISITKQGTCKQIEARATETSKVLDTKISPKGHCELFNNSN